MASEPLVTQPSPKSSSLRIPRLLAFSAVVGVQTMHLYSNWPLAILDELHVGTSKEFVLRLRNGIRFRVRAGMKDWYAINEMWVSCPYFDDEVAVRGAKTIVDIGAHIGAFSLLAAYLTRGACIFAYEPFPSTHRLLLDNISLNAGITQSTVVPCQSAIAGTCGVRKLYAAGSTAAGHSLCFGTVDEGAEVQTVKLEDALDENSIQACDFLKLDCEGAEYEILLASSESCLRRIKMIAAECHEVPGQNTEQLRRRLTEVGFAVRFRHIPLFSARFPAYRSLVLLARNRTWS